MTVLPFALALLLTTGTVDPQSCGTIVPGEASAFAFFRTELAAGIAAGRYTPDLENRVTPMLRKLEDWETQCDGTSQREAVLDLRKSIGRTRNKGDRSYMQALLATGLSRGVEIRVPDSRGGLFITARRFSNSEREARRLFDDLLPRWPERALAREYAALALATLDPSTLRTADAALDRMIRAGHGDEELRLLQAMIVVGRRDAKRAAELARFAETGSTRGKRVAAITQLLAGSDPERAGKAYLAALDEARPEDVVLFYEDLWPLLLEHHDHEYAQLARTAQASWIRAEWEWRASTSSRTVGHRLRIHFERALHAIDWYPRLSFRGAGRGDALVLERSAGAPFDDRGLIYIRHGQPEEILYQSLIAQAWFYEHLNTPKGAGLFEFAKPEKTVDWVIKGPGTCGGGGSRSAAASSMDWEITLARFDPPRGTIAMLCYAANLAALRGDPVRAEMAMQGMQLRLLERQVTARRRAETAMRTEDASPKLERFYRGVLTSYAFRTDANSTELLAFLLMPVSDITAHPQTQAGVRFDIATSLAVEHARTRRVERRDSVLAVNLLSQPTPDQALHITFGTRAEADSAATVRFTVGNPNRAGEGQVFISRRPIPSFATGTFALSDIVIAQAIDGGPLVRGSERLTPMAGHLVPQNGTVRVFHEVYGVNMETPVKVRITIAPVMDAGILERLRSAIARKEALDLEFDDVLEPRNGVSYLTRDITAALDPGRYQVRVEIRTANAVAAGITDITVIERK